MKRYAIYDNNGKECPDWVKDAVIYYILPDCFANHKQSIQKPDEGTEDNKVNKSDRYGGTIQGITDNLDYLLKLGINCICIDPFQSVGESGLSEAIDCYRIASCYGSEEEFRFFVDMCHNCSFRLILTDTVRILSSDTTEDDKKKEIYHCWAEEFHIDGWFVESIQKPDNGQEPQFIDLCRDFFALQRMDAATFDKNICKIISDHSKLSLRKRINRLDGPFEERFLTLCKEKQELFRLAIIFQMTFIGTPLILYGDEQSIFDTDDNFRPMAMIWKDNEKGLFPFYKAAIYLRKKLVALRRGDYQVLQANNESKLLIFERNYEEQKLIIAVNAGEDEEELKLIPKTYQLIWQNGCFEDHIAGYGFLIAGLRQPIVDEADHTESSR